MPTKRKPKPKQPPAADYANVSSAKLGLLGMLRSGRLLFLELKRLEAMERKASESTKTTCDECGGSGDNHFGEGDCPLCSGSGQITKDVLIHRQSQRLVRQADDLAALREQLRAKC